jgi:hypothetical protein
VCFDIKTLKMFAVWSFFFFCRFLAMIFYYFFVCIFTNDISVKVLEWNHLSVWASLVYSSSLLNCLVHADAHHFGTTNWLPLYLYPVLNDMLYSSYKHNLLKLSSSETMRNIIISHTLLGLLLWSCIGLSMAKKKTIFVEKWCVASVLSTCGGNFEVFVQ